MLLELNFLSFLQGIFPGRSQRLCPRATDASCHRPHHWRSLPHAVQSSPYTGGHRQANVRPQRQRQWGQAAALAVQRVRRGDSRLLHGRSTYKCRPGPTHCVWMYWKYDRKSTAKEVHDVNIMMYIPVILTWDIYNIMKYSVISNSLLFGNDLMFNIIMFNIILIHVCSILY